MRRRIRVARWLGEGREPPRGTVDDELKDFEDAMQVAAARSCGADVIVTRNLKDYQHAPLSALTPKQVLASLL